MRQVKQFTQALEAVLFKKREGQKQKAQDIITQTLGELVEGDSDDFHQLSLKETVSTLENGGNFNAELALIVADLLYEQGELANKNKSYKYYMQALLLYQKALKNPDVAFPIEATQKISQIKSTLDSSDLKKVEELLA